MNTHANLSREYDGLRAQQIIIGRKMKAIRDSINQTRSALIAEKNARREAYAREIVYRWVNGETMAGIARSLGVRAESPRNKADWYLRHIAPLEYRKMRLMRLNQKRYINEHRSYFKIPEPVDAPPKT